MHSEDKRAFDIVAGCDLPNGPCDRLRRGDRPTLIAFETILKTELAELAATDPSVATLQVNPETFTWLDGVDGRRRRHAPAFLMTTVAGTKTYRDVKPLALLVRDPELSGRRARVELECAARGAAFEIWTEREIRETRDGRSLMRVATPDEAAIYHDASRVADRGAGAVPGIARKVANRLGLTHLRKVGSVFVARSHLTGIPMAVLCDLVEDAEAGFAVWRPKFFRPERRRDQL